MGKVMVGWLDDGECQGAFAESMLNMVTVGAANGVIAGWRRLEIGPVLSLGRNLMAESFLKTDNEWLLTVDSDMRFKHDLLDQLLAVADPATHPIVAPVCYTIKDDQVATVIYGMVDSMFCRLSGEQDQEVVRVDGVGFGCVLIHRTVFDRIAANHKMPGKWFDPMYLKGEPLGEDLAFCMRARAAGIPIHAHTTIPIDHLRGHLAINREMYLATRKEK